MASTSGISKTSSAAGAVSTPASGGRYRPHREQRAQHAQHAQPETGDVSAAAHTFFGMLTRLRPGQPLNIKSWTYKVGGNGPAGVMIEKLIFAAGMSIPSPFLAAQMFWRTRGLYLVNMGTDGINIFVTATAPDTSMTLTHTHSKRPHAGNKIPAVDEQVLAFYGVAAPRPEPVASVPTLSEFPAMGVVTAIPATTVSGYATAAAAPAAAPVIVRVRPHRPQLEQRPRESQKGHTDDEWRALAAATTVLLVKLGVAAADAMENGNASVRVEERDQVIRAGGAVDNIRNILYGHKTGESDEEREKYWERLEMENPFVTAQRQVFEKTQFFLLNFAKDSSRLFFVLYATSPSRRLECFHGQNMPPRNIAGIERKARAPVEFVPPPKAKDFPALAPAAPGRHFEQSFAAAASAPQKSWWDDDGDAPDAAPAPAPAPAPAARIAETEEQRDKRIAAEIGSKFPEIGRLEREQNSTSTKLEQAKLEQAKASITQFPICDLAADDMTSESEKLEKKVSELTAALKKVSNQLTHQQRLRDKAIREAIREAKEKARLESDSDTDPKTRDERYKKLRDSGALSRLARLMDEL